MTTKASHTQRVYFLILNNNCYHNFFSKPFFYENISKRIDFFETFCDFYIYFDNRFTLTAKLGTRVIYWTRRWTFIWKFFYGNEKFHKLNRVTYFKSLYLYTYTSFGNKVVHLVISDQILPVIAHNNKFVKWKMLICVSYFLNIQLIYRFVV